MLVKKTAKIPPKPLVKGLAVDIDAPISGNLGRVLGYAYQSNGFLIRHPLDVVDENIYCQSIRDLAVSVVDMYKGFKDMKVIETPLVSGRLLALVEVDSKELSKMVHTEALRCINKEDKRRENRAKDVKKGKSRSKHSKPASVDIGIDG